MTLPVRFHFYPTPLEPSRKAKGSLRDLQTHATILSEVHVLEDRLDQDTRTTLSKSRLHQSKVSLSTRNVRLASDPWKEAGETFEAFKYRRLAKLVIIALLKQLDGKKTRGTRTDNKAADNDVGFYDNVLHVKVRCHLPYNEQQRN
ncbi:MAG: hypothetical protein M1814_000652 [Vezdaea aestivalis]|nr:MAG: hypothetical protein M1814_000652 [Vezdaea aestivalis]